MEKMSRREAIGGMGAIGLAVGAGPAFGQPRGREDRAGRGGDRAWWQGGLGWDERAGKFVLPDLPYDAGALEPHVDEQTMRIHHDRHHQGYVNGLNTAMERLAELRAGNGDPATLEHWQRKLSFNAGGHVNHTLFWANMAPEAETGEPQGSLLKAIERDLGGVERFSQHFRDTAAAVEGSGWAWLVHEAVSGRLMVLQMHNQQHSLFAGVTPLLGVDVWEHAYYLRYQNRRADYLAGFMNVINWREVARRYDAVAGA